MAEDRQGLQSYLSKSTKYKKPHPLPADEEESEHSSIVDRVKKAEGDERRLSEDGSPDGLTNVTPPPELGDNLNA